MFGIQDHDGGRTGYHKRRRIRTGRRACGDGSAACGNLCAAEEKRSIVGAAGEQVFWRYDMFDEFGERELSEVIVESVKSWRDFLLW